MRKRLRIAQNAPNGFEVATSHIDFEVPSGDCRPPDVAKLLAVAYTFGSAPLNLPAANPLPPIMQSMVNLIVRKDQQSEKAARIYADYFRTQNPDHPQARMESTDHFAWLAGRVATKAEPVRRRSCLQSDIVFIILGSVLATRSNSLMRMLIRMSLEGDR